MPIEALHGDRQPSPSIGLPFLSSTVQDDKLREDFLENF